MAFRREADTHLWNIMMMDHGYQPPPVWTMVGGTVARLIPASDAGLRALTMIDIVLLAEAFGLIFWAFGLRATFAGLFFFGSEWPSNAFFMGRTFPSP